jgi:hypothetical protein
MADRANYGEYAAHCVREAELSSVQEHKALLLMMAQAWLRLAEQREAVQMMVEQQRSAHSA